MPYIFLTNGGGLKEADKAEQLSKKMGVHVSSLESGGGGNGVVRGFCCFVGNGHHL